MGELIEIVRRAYSEPSSFEGQAVRIVLALAPLVILGLMITARFSSWRRLSRKYPRQEPVDGTRIVLGKTWIRSFGYGRVSVKASATHAHFMMPSVVRILGYPTFSVPWNEISLAEKPHPLFAEWSRVIALTLARAPDIPLSVSIRAGTRLAAASHGRLQMPETPPRALRA